LHRTPVVIKDNVDVGIIVAKASLSEFTRGIADDINSVILNIDPAGGSFTEQR
jgi:hypothetical protein